MPNCHSVGERSPGPGKMTANAFADARLVRDTTDCFFYHTMELPEFGLQVGQWDLRGDFAQYAGHVDFRDKRVIDIGTGSGFLTFSAEAAGAKEIVSFDMDDPSRQHLLPFQESPAYADPEAFLTWHRTWLEQWKNAYWLCHRLLGSRALATYGDIYNIRRDIGTFDIALVCSVLEHLSDPIRALASIARVTTGEIVITTPLIPTEDRIASFLGDSTKPELNYVWWTYSLGVYREVLRMLGFEIDRVEEGRGSFLYVDEGTRHTRSIIVARRVRALI